MRCGKTPSGYARALAAVFVYSAKTRSRHPSLLAWDNYSSQPFGASSILLLKAAGTLKYASKIAPCLICASSRTVLFSDALATSGVGFVQPSSRSPLSTHLKSHSRQRRPTRLQVARFSSTFPIIQLDDVSAFYLPLARPRLRPARYRGNILGLGNGGAG